MFDMFFKSFIDTVPTATHCVPSNEIFIHCPVKKGSLATGVHWIPSLEEAIAPTVVALN